MRILTAAAANTKTAKTADKAEQAILHLLPAKLSGYNVCPFHTDGCANGCLNSSGRGIFNSVQTARLNRTLLFFEDRPTFWKQVIADIRTLERRASKSGKPVAVRLNGTSDIMWERQKTPSGATIFEQFPDVNFYDYTKIPRRRTPGNYHLTFSLAEANQTAAETELANGRNIAAVFRSQLPARYMGTEVIDGDKSDLRYLDAAPRIVGLIAKGKAKKDSSGFVKE
jgi:hypothetical protein